MHLARLNEELFENLKNMQMKITHLNNQNSIPYSNKNANFNDVNIHRNLNGNVFSEANHKEKIYENNNYDNINQRNGMNNRHPNYNENNNTNKYKNDYYLQNGNENNGDVNYRMNSNRKNNYSMGKIGNTDNLERNGYLEQGNEIVDKFFLLNC